MGYTNANSATDSKLTFTSRSASVANNAICTTAVSTSDTTPSTIATPSLLTLLSPSDIEGANFR